MEFKGVIVKTLICSKNFTEDIAVAVVNPQYLISYWDFKNTRLAPLPIPLMMPTPTSLIFRRSRSFAATHFPDRLRIRLDANKLRKILFWVGISRNCQIHGFLNLYIIAILLPQDYYVLIVWVNRSTMKSRASNDFVKKICLYSTLVTRAVYLSFVF